MVISPTTLRFDLSNDKKLDTKELKIKSLTNSFDDLGITFEKINGIKFTHEFDDDILKKIEEGWDDFDIAIATPEMMPKIAKLGKHLGRKGLMPNPRSGTVVQEDKLVEAVEKANKGRVEIRMDKDAIIHTRIGLCSFSEEQIIENLSSVYSTIVNNKPDGVKGSLIDSASICSTMGPGITLDLDNLRESVVN